jgi:hypothetical protein
MISKDMEEPEGPQITSQYGAYALHAGLARLYALMRMHTPMRPGTRIHARTHAHTDQYIILIAFPRQQLLANAPQCDVVRTLPVLFNTVYGTLVTEIAFLSSKVQILKTIFNN